MSLDTKLRLALAVCRAQVGRTGENIARTRELCARAREDGAELILFPELSLCGYQVEPETASGCAEEPDGPLAQQIRSLAAEQDIWVLAGFVEKRPPLAPCISHLAAGPDGSVRVFRKLHQNLAEASAYSPGDELRLFSVKGFCMGLSICYDAHFPELFTRLAAAGADAVLCPHASPRGTAAEKLQSWLRHLTARAFDNGIYIAAVNQSGENGAGLSFPGGAVAISPLGRVLATDDSGAEGLLFTEFSRQELDHVRGHRMRYFLPRRRADLFELPLRGCDE